MRPISETINAYQIVDDVKNHVNKSTPSSNITLNNHNGNNEICRLKMHSFVSCEFIYCIWYFLHLLFASCY
ncbi:uncharacterized protein DC041_0004255 [Schistosoma bovis]|uniref:Uncharacterized protein n=1 Tax=Schistosoma bovis TaxID=6184 RepID=A0A430Q8L1_SCHBO|nr:uncharacterized protein DC041_0004255 [Schistosoma bovis]